MIHANLAPMVVAAAAMLLIYGAGAIYVAAQLVWEDSGAGDGVDQIFAWIPLAVAGLAILALVLVRTFRADRPYLAVAGGIAVTLAVYVVLLAWIAGD